MTTDFDPLRSLLENEKHLTEKLEQLKANLHQAGEQQGNLADDEVATERIELDKFVAQQKLIRDSLAEVQHALHKFDEGTYGLCDACGQPIELSRLEALPQASLCLSCKARKGREADWLRRKRGK